MRDASFAELVNIADLQRLMELFCTVTGVAVGIVAPDGSILAEAAQQDICSCYHRKHPITDMRCEESRREMASRLQPHEHVAYRCPQGLWDAAMPLVIEGRVLATLYVGPFFYSGESVDVEFFRRQARDFGFPEEQYLEAVRRVPVYSREHISAVLDYWQAFVELLSELGQANARYRLMADNASDVIWIVNMQLEPVYISPSVERMLGYTVEEAMQLTPEQIYSPESYEQSERLMRDALAAQTANPHRTHTSVEEVEVRHRDGHLVPAECSYTFLRQGRQLEGVLTIARDITTRRAMQQAIQESERKFRGLIESTSDWVWQIDPDHVFIYTSDRVHDLLGYEPDEIMGRTLSEFMASGEGQRIRSLIALKVARGEPLRADRCRWLHRDGHEVILDTNATLQFDAAGAFSGLFGASSDVSDQAQAEGVLRLSEQRFRTLFENMVEGVALHEIIRGPDGEPLDYRIVEVNPPYGAILGLDRAEVIGRLGSELSGTSPAPLLEEFARCAASGEMLRLERHVPASDEYFSVSVVPWGEDGCAAIYANTSERKRAEEAQRLAAVGQLAGGVAHEFNNLMCGLWVAADLATAQDDLANFRDLGKLVINAARKGARVCQDLTNFARPGVPRRALMPLEEAIEQALGLTALQLSSSNITILRDYATEGRLVYADRSQMEQVFLNLLLNAQQAMKEGGELTLATNWRVGPDGREEVVATVTDTGVGIAPEHLPRIFEPFFTTKSTLAEEPPTGSGLGLSVSRGFIEAHGGTISARSTLGQGATVEIALQAHPPQATVAPTEPPAVEPLPQPPPSRVLLVEDETALRLGIAGILAEQGHEVREADSSVPALALMEKYKFDLIITDLMMPGGRGEEVLLRAATLPNRPLVLVMTGRLSPNLADGLREAGADRLLTKPFGLTELLNEVSSLLLAKR